MQRCTRHLQARAGSPSWPVAHRCTLHSATGRHAPARFLATPHGQDGDGDSSLQEELLAQLRTQIQNQRVKQEIKEEIEEDLKGRVEGLRQLGSELQDELSEGLRIEKFRTELESGEVLSDAMGKFDELEDEIQALTDKIKADRADLLAWEQESAAARNSSLFFKSLYKADGPPIGDADAADALDAAAARRAAQAVKAPAEEEVHSPLRLYLFAYMAAVLAAVALSDVVSPEPSYITDGLYAVIATALGVNAWSERQVLASQAAETAAAEVAGADGSGASSSVTSQASGSAAEDTSS